jgi:hypothetical protein
MNTTAAKINVFSTGILVGNGRRMLDPEYANAHGDERLGNPGQSIQ